ncbi:hypothetical protein PICMEDRAFT_74864 [Pichia membranifaciens NRRL Y-2026]|uniref:U three protein 23 n=1 Tax=Pichia membranifaciens NRRL Y-2026 TaxID=763406 RepID=A0A1E3NDQ3_9ASCO|nr:hypothetical protein PICMEDRAFT_74864 [Pichia membranifaciens NRRL Y-2026]ODQ44259.1 hypothetical protein PICMEDRAFT_74864 [Pichia membranifaciens NRRL Y-2026]
MRQKRAKQYRKQIQVLKTTFKFKTPIQCVVDDSTILEATNANYDLVKGMDGIVQHETKYFVTQCCVQHLYDSENQQAIDLAKRMEKRRCGHKDTLSSFECIKSITNVDGENKYRYLVVTQDERLRTSLRNVAGVPLCFLYRSVLVMEPMSTVTKRVVQAVERMKLTQGLNSVDAGKRVRDGDEDVDPVQQEVQAQRKKRVKGVNPLAMKKKAKKAKKDAVTTGPTKEDRDPSEAAAGDGKKRRRRRHTHKTNSAEEETREEPAASVAEPATPVVAAADE